MLNYVCKTNQTLRSRFIAELRKELYSKEDFTQGEYIEALDNVVDRLRQNPDINLEELDSITKSLTLDWKDIGETIRTDNQNQKIQTSLALIIGATALVTSIIMWLIMRKK